MKVLNLIFIVVFVLPVVLQYNDPDPYIWIPLYLYGTFVCYQALRRKSVPAFYITAM